jgi:hypothetical protein
MNDPDKPMSHSELRKFGLVTALMLVIFFDGLIPWIWDFKPPLWPVIVGGVLVFMALLLPGWLSPVYKVWMRFANVLGWVNTRIILGVIFFLIFLPVGIVLRLFRDPMRRKWDGSSDTYRMSSRDPKPDNMERPF